MRPADLTLPPGESGDIRWGMGDAVGGVLVAFVASVLLGGLGLAIAGVEDTDTIPLWGVALLELPLWAGLVGAPLWASYRKGRRSLAEDFGLRMAWRDIPIGLGAGLLGQIVLGLALLPLYELIGIDQDEVGQTATELADRADDPFGVVCLFLVVVVGAPIFEELFYRGLWLRSAARRFGMGAAIALSSVVFGLGHFQAADTIALVGFGVLASVLAARAGRLGPAIWAHIAFNLTALVSLLSS